jgi:hypothetical protein
MHLLAERVIGFEKRAYKSASSAKPVVAVVCDKLLPALGMLMGNGGFRVLLTRALARAAALEPSLRAARVTIEGALIIESGSAPLDQKKLETGSILLVAEVLGLLNAFIGENLTIQFVREAWPRLSFNKSPNSGSGGKKK